MKLLVADDIDDSAIERMRAAGIEVIVKTSLKPDQLIKEIPPYDAIAVRSATKVTAEIIDAAANLKLIVRAGVGLDNVDQMAAETRGITVKNTPAATSMTVAEYTMGLMLTAVRHIAQAHTKLMQGIWDKKSFMGSELYGKRLGLVGLGRIGREVAKRAQAFGMEVIAHDPLINQNEVDIPLCSLEEVIKTSDIISLHLPTTAETRNLIDRKRISQMKKGSYLINAARGGIVDEAAVAEAVKSGHLAGAAFDVFATEPLKESPLIGVPGITLTPHLGASSNEGQERAGDELASIVIEFAS